MVAKALLVKDPLMELDEAAGVLVAAGVICASCLHEAMNNTKASVAKSVATLALQLS